MRTANWIGEFVVRHKFFLAALCLTMLPGCPDHARALFGILQ